MKKLILVPVILVVMCLFTTPVLADDGIDVDIGILTPDDVTVDVDINAGGDVNVTVDGVDFKDTAHMAQSAYDKLKNTNALYDFIYHWDRTGLKAYYDGKLSEYNQLIELLAMSQAKLINSNELNQSDISQIVDTLNNASVSIMGIESTIDNLKEQEEKTWNQLMYGAEEHIGILQDIVQEQSTEIDNNKSEIEALKSKIKAMDEYDAILANWASNNFSISYDRFIYLLMGSSLLICVLFITTIVLFVKVKKIR